MGHPVPTKVFLKPYLDVAMLFAPYGCATHFSLSHPKDTAGSDIQVS